MIQSLQDWSNVSHGRLSIFEILAMRISVASNGFRFLRDLCDSVRQFSRSGFFHADPPAAAEVGPARRAAPTRRRILTQKRRFPGINVITYAAMSWRQNGASYI